MKHVLTRAGALLGATTLATMAMGPALAAETVAQAEANALTVAVAGEGGDSGTVRATHDGEELTKTGDTEPPVSVLQGQDLLDVGTHRAESLSQCAARARRVPRTTDRR